MKILWIGGWAIPTDITKTIVCNVFPQHNHFFIHPHEKSLESIHTFNPNIIVAYSLGSTLLLQYPSNIPQQYLIAPFLNIKDATLIQSAQLHYLLKWLKNDPLNAINDFYQRSQLSLPKLNTLPYPLTDLIWGIETLIKTQTISHYSDKQILIGNQDPLINPNFFLKNFPNSTTFINTNHNLQAYLSFLPF